MQQKTNTQRNKRKDVRMFNPYDPETAHGLAILGLRVLGLPAISHVVRAYTHTDCRAVTIAGVTFPNRIGIAAGFDKNAVAVRGLAALGAGFVEVGTVVPEPQVGNARPRVFRLSEDRSIINRYGFNSVGVEQVKRNLTAMGAAPIPVGVNIGPNKEAVGTDAALAQYQRCFAELAPFADYVVMNISSPNTPGLRDLQTVESIRNIATALAPLTASRSVPVFVKVAPDMNDDDFRNVMQACEENFDGIVIGNTTVARPSWLQSAQRDETGGLSGPPLLKRMLVMVRIARELAPNFPIIAAGGISNARDVRSACEAGADLVQVYTALAYEGPLFIRNTLRDLKRS